MKERELHLVWDTFQQCHQSVSILTTLKNNNSDFIRISNRQKTDMTEYRNCLLVFVMSLSAIYPCTGISWL